MNAKQNSLLIAALVFIVWTTIILVVTKLQLGAAKIALDELVARSLVVTFVIAPLFLLIVVGYFRWQRKVGLKAADPAGSWKILWLPMLFVIAFLALGSALGLPPPQVLMFVFINTMLVGISEELMFRGLIFYGALTKFGIRSAILITSIWFGSVHALNGFLTGDFTSAAAQALAATLSGVWFMAIRLRTNSVYPGMIIHGLWDFGVFILSRSGKTNNPAATAGSVEMSVSSQFLFPILLVLPLFLYGLWLLRGIGKRSGEDFIS